jgi:FKBP-type peptidyl-prolyl cis-trans isomerase SlpA
MTHKISPGSRVTLHLSLTLADGTIAESTFGAEPLLLTMGDGSLLRGLEIALYGLAPGARQRLELAPQQTYGLHDPELVYRVPRPIFPADMELAPGVIVGFETGAGEEAAGTILELDNETVQVDFNHPLAGHTLVFEVEILKVEAAATENDTCDEV